ncbi:hypothetical protein AOQ84DRAFT_266213, partial [Glonium stellatum]
CGYDYNDNYVCENSSWNNWVRWVVLAIVIIGFILLFVLFACFTARRRRRAGQNPYYGTGWAANRPPPGQYNQPYYSNQPAPPYSPPQANQYYGSNQGYFGQQNGIELQSPQATHYPPRSGDNVYSPPPGPPPQK